MKIQKKFLDNVVNRFLKETIEDKTNQIMEKLKYGNLENAPTEFDYVAEGELCEYCGGEMKESECMECGSGKYMMEGNVCECGSGMKENECMECGRRGMEVMEKKQRMKKLSPTQKRELDVDDDNKITAKDFKYLRRHKEETKESVKRKKESKEGNAFTAMLKKTPKGGKFELGGKKYIDKSSLDEEVLYKLSDGKNQELFTENEIIDLIENIVMEEKKTNIKKSPSTAGYSAYEKSFKGSGKENKEYLDSVAKKMVEYIKDGSKGKYDMNPKFFPKGNGQLEKMNSMKYTMSKDGNEFLDDYMRPGMESLVPDELQYDEDWMKDNIEGSSRTGNNPEWANAEETELGEKINKKRKNQKYHKAKMMAYRKSKQPVTDGVGENAGEGLKITTESLDGKTKGKLNEEFNRMKSLMGYNNKTQ